MKSAPAALDAAPDVATAPRRRGRPRKSEGERDEGNRRQELIRAAAKLFRRKGFDATTTRDIAAAVGMHSGSPFYHFESKRALLQAVMEEGLRAASARLQDVLARSADDPPSDARPLMRRVIRAHFDTLLAPGQDFIPVMLYEWRSLTPRQRAAVAKFSDAYEDLWRPMLRRLADEGRLRGDLALARLLMFGAMNWSAQWYDRGKGASLDDLADATMALFVHEDPHAAHGISGGDTRPWPPSATSTKRSSARSSASSPKRSTRTSRNGRRRRSSPRTRCSSAWASSGCSA